jgi:hypothetical protein
MQKYPHICIAQGTAGTCTFLLLETEGAGGWGVGQGVGILANQRISSKHTSLAGVVHLTHILMGAKYC